MPPQPEGTATTTASTVCMTETCASCSGDLAAPVPRCDKAMQSCVLTPEGVAANEGSYIDSFKTRNDLAFAPREEQDTRSFFS